MVRILLQDGAYHSQTAVLGTAYFENDMLHLEEVFVPPLSSNTMSAKDSEDAAGGRPEKEDNQKSDKTLINKESENRG